MRLDRGEPVETQGASRSVDGLEVVHAPYGKLKPGPGRSGEEVSRHQSERIQAAMVELVSERGYGSVTVRQLAGCAGVSTRSFYQHYPGKEACFLATLRALARKALGSLQIEALGGSEDLRLVVDTMARHWGADPPAARLLLIDAYRAGEPALEQARRLEAMLDARVRLSLARADVDPAVSTGLATGILGGLLSVARSRLLNRRGSTLTHEADELAGWAEALLNPSLVELARLDRARNADSRQLSSPVSSSESAWDGRGSNADTDLALLLSATAKLAIRDGGETLTPRDILAAAGLPRRRFAAHFSGADACLSAALSLAMEEAVNVAAQAAQRGGTAAGGVYRAMAALCDCVERDRLFAGLCLDDRNLATATARLDAHDRIVSELGSLALKTSSGSPVDGLGGEVAAGATWALLRHQVATRSTGQEIQLPATLAYFTLAPLVGGPPAIDALRGEQDLAAHQGEAA
jgi:AcrR family transcriptional regulator